MEDNFMLVNSNKATQGAAAPPALRQRRAKSLWLTVHRWLGVILGLPIALIGLTGSLILLAPLFLVMQHGDLLERPRIATSSSVSPLTWVAAVRAANTSKLEIIAVSAPNSSPLAADTALVIGHTHEGLDGENHRVFSVNPDTGELKGYYDFETSYAFIPTAIHTSLMIPLIGLDIVAVIGILLLISSATGIYLWWPSAKNWKAALSLKLRAKGLARWFNLHNFFGFYSAIAIFMLSASGVWMLKPEWVDPAVRTISPIRDAPADSLIAKSGSCIKSTSVEAAIELAMAHVPDGKLAYLLSPEDYRKYYEVNFSHAGNWNMRDGDTTVYVDPNCARVVDTIYGGKLSVGEAAKRSAAPIHNGLIFGTVGQIIVFLAGLALPILYVSGLILWWRRRKKNRVA
jgi:uncharacterized iron-regulated membrane protein